MRKRASRVLGERRADTPLVYYAHAVFQGAKFTTFSALQTRLPNGLPQQASHLINIPLVSADYIPKVGSG